MISKINRKNPNLNIYINLIHSFLNDSMLIADFEKQYLSLFKQGNTEWELPVYNILNELFGDIDAFCPDPNLRDERDLDENQIRQKCKIALNKLLILNTS